MSSTNNPWDLDVNDEAESAGVAPLDRSPAQDSAGTRLETELAAEHTEADLTADDDFAEVHSVVDPTASVSGAANAAVNRSSYALTPTQREVLDDLLEVGSDRPVTPPGAVDTLTDTIRDLTSERMQQWTEPRLWVSKSLLGTAHRCEGNLLAQNQSSAPFFNTPIVAGQVAHRAIQVTHTHPGMHVEDYVKAAIVAQRDSDSEFSAFWDSAGAGLQSDVMSSSAARVTAYLDSWPTLLPEWTPRFEDGIQARAGDVVMAARPDLTLGRPRPDFTQTMLLVDFKTGGLKPEHEMEASYYALVAALRYGVFPYKSVVYSLASGEWVSPPVDTHHLMQAAQWVADGVCKIVDVRGALREPELTVNPGCRWCPARDTCPAYAQSQQEARKPAQ